MWYLKWKKKLKIWSAFDEDIYLDDSVPSSVSYFEESPDPESPNDPSLPSLQHNNSLSSSSTFNEQRRRLVRWKVKIKSLPITLINVHLLHYEIVTYIIIILLYLGNLT